ncbi:unnamed protein product [marine sediment metagenome]|uniref:Uncharacterized protein n=1 Tax=marine sediment metagenome TaxID=412755 RepID=X1QTY2_9ZZZZ
MFVPEGQSKIPADGRTEDYEFKIIYEIGKALTIPYNVQKVNAGEPDARENRRLRIQNHL